MTSYNITEFDPQGAGAPTDIGAGLVAAMRAVGIDPDLSGGHPIADNALHRIDALGKKKKRNKHVWYVLHPDEPASGAFGDLQLGIEETWTAKRPKEMSAAEKDALQKRMEDTRRQRAAELKALNAAAAVAAAEIWEAAEKPDPAHPYLAKKGLAPTPNVRQLNRNVRYKIEDDEDPKTARAGNLVVPIYRPNRKLASVQLIGPDGRKHFLKGGEKKGCYVSMGKPKGERPVIIICEGYSTGARLFHITGQVVVVAFDSGNLRPVAKTFRRKFPDARIVIAADNDRFTTKPVENPGKTKAMEAAADPDVGAVVAVPEFGAEDTESSDFDDLARVSGDDAVKDAIRAALSPRKSEPEPQPERTQRPLTLRVDRPKPTEVRGLSIAGFDLESASSVHLARVVASILRRSFEDVVYDEGAIYVYHDGLWHRLDPHRDLGPLIIQFDGQPAGRRDVKMNPKLRRDIVEDLGLILLSEQSAEPFFASAPIGVPVENGFVAFEGDEIVLREPSPANGARWRLPARFDPELPEHPPEGSMLGRLLNGSFKEDDDRIEKTALAAEMYGAAISGQATRLVQPQAFFLIGENAENGKSAFLRLLRALLASSACVSVPPKAFGDERHVIRLLGAAANVVDEVDDAAIASAEFKKAITGETLTARGLYRDAVEFTPRALHVYSANDLPQFANGFDRGVRRRVMPISFNRTIPINERVEGIAERIVAEECSQLLSFAIHGAQRLRRRGRYTEPKSSSEKRVEWGRGDPIFEWCAHCVEPLEKKPVNMDWPRRHQVYRMYRDYAEAEGFGRHRIVDVDKFWRTLKTVPGIRTAKNGGYAVLYARLRPRPVDAW